VVGPGAGGANLIVERSHIPCTAAIGS